MEGKNELTEIDLKNRMCYYFDDMIIFWDTNNEFGDIFLDKKLYKKKIRKYFNL